MSSSSELTKNILAGIVRWLLVLISGILVKKGIITTSQGDTYVAQFLPVALGAAMAGVALVWSILRQKHANKKVDIALSLPAGTGRATLEKAVDQA